MIPLLRHPISTVHRMIANLKIVEADRRKRREQPRAVSIIVTREWSLTI